MRTSKKLWIGFEQRVLLLQQKKQGELLLRALVGVTSEGLAGAIIEVNSETDFVSRNKDFQKLVKSLDISLSVGGGVNDINISSYSETGCTVEDEITQQIATIGENISIRRSEVLSVSKGIIATYVHSSLNDGLGKIGVLVELNLKATQINLQF